MQDFLIILLIFTASCLYLQVNCARMPVRRALGKSMGNVVSLQSKTQGQHCPAFLSDKLYKLTELVNDQVISSLIQLSATGDVTFLHSDQPDEVRQVRGLWQICNNGLHMAIERTYQSRWSEVTVRSTYQATREDISNGFLTIAGDIHDEQVDENSFETGQFMVMAVESIERDKSFIEALGRLRAVSLV